MNDVTVYTVYYSIRRLYFLSVIWDIMQGWNSGHNGVWGPLSALITLTLSLVNVGILRTYFMYLTTSFHENHRQTMKTKVHILHIQLTICKSTDQYFSSFLILYFSKTMANYTMPKVQILFLNHLFILGYAYLPCNCEKECEHCIFFISILSFICFTVTFADSSRLAVKNLDSF